MATSTASLDARTAPPSPSPASTKQDNPDTQFPSLEPISSPHPASKFRKRPGGGHKKHDNIDGYPLLRPGSGAHKRDDDDDVSVSQSIEAAIGHERMIQIIALIEAADDAAARDIPQPPAPHDDPQAQLEQILDHDLTAKVLSLLPSFTSMRDSSSLISRAAPSEVTEIQFPFRIPIVIPNDTAELRDRAACSSSSLLQGQTNHCLLPLNHAAAAAALLLLLLLLLLPFRTRSRLLTLPPLESQIRILRRGGN